MTFPYKDTADSVDVDFYQSFVQTRVWVLINPSQPNVAFHIETKSFVLQRK